MGVNVSNILKEVDIKAQAGRLWFGFPHWIVLGWAILVSWQVWRMVEWRSSHEIQVQVSNSQVAQATTRLADTVGALQREVQKMREDSIRTRTLLELKFPMTARRVDEAIAESENE